MEDNAVKIFTLKNQNGVEIQFTPHGGRIVSIKVPSASGEIADVVIGYDTPEESVKGDLYFGALCGRFANRIANGRFIIDGMEFRLDTNNANNHLHGGFEGFHTRVWDVKKTQKPGSVDAWELTLVSPDGDQKYPGELKVRVVYSLTSDNSFIIEYEAETSKPTVINLTSHPYFNLRGAGTGDVLQHELEIKADNFTVIDPEQGTCTGEILPVAGTALDFRSPKALKDAVGSDFAQVRLVDGMDHNFVLNGGGGIPALAAILRDPVSGRTLEVYTDQPGIQVYTGNHFDGSEIGKKGTGINKYAGVALETQTFPNSPNVGHFPNAILRPGEKYNHICIYKFK
jgi:aldose 1-epimerase